MSEPANLKSYMVAISERNNSAWEPYMWNSAFPSDPLLHHSGKPYWNETVPQGLKT